MFFKSFFKSALILTLVITAQHAAAQDVVLTPVGQSPDVIMVNVILKRMKVDASVQKLLTAEELSNQKVIVAVAGGSSKGLGAAGIDKDQEIERVSALLAAAKQKGINVVVMHVGGKGRRGKLSDIFIETALSHADKVIVVKDGNLDGFFNERLSGSNVEILTAESLSTVSVPLKAVLQNWRIIEP